MLSGQTPARVWNTRRTEKQRRLASVPVQGKVLPTADLTAMLEKLIAPGDRVVLEGNNQKQADFLSRMLAEVNPQIVHDLHMIMPSVGRSEHLDIFEKGIARKLDFSFPAPKVCASRNCWKMACWKLAPSTPTSNFIPVFTSTWRQTWR